MLHVESSKVIHPCEIFWKSEFSNATKEGVRHLNELSPGPAQLDFDSEPKLVCT